MSSPVPRQAHRSRWSVAATVAFALAALAFGVFWTWRPGSGIELMFTRGAAVMSFASLWGLGALCLALGVVQAWRQRWTPTLGALARDHVDGGR